MCHRLSPSSTPSSQPHFQDRIRAGEEREHALQTTLVRVSNERENSAKTIHELEERLKELSKQSPPPSPSPSLSPSASTGPPSKDKDSAVVERLKRLEQMGTDLLLDDF